MLWSDYSQNWVPRWGLRNSSVISPSTQILHSVLVPEVRRQHSLDLLFPILNQANRRAIEAQ